jgi:D-3-phosphoglycerate dehydrogenase
MSVIAITDYFTEPTEEKEILGDLVGMDVKEDTKVLLVWHEQINEEYCKNLPNLRGVQRYGVGYDNLDLNYLRSRNIVACNNPDYGVDEVSDTALAFIMGISRGVYRYDQLAQKLNGSWQENVLPDLKRNSDLIIGVIGAGRIGSSVLLKCRAIGFQTAFYDPYKVSGHEKVLGARRYLNLEEMLAASDIVSIHCPLNETSAGMVNENFIGSMKTGSSLVNTARGAILAGSSLIYNALKSKRLMSAAFDVLPDEPPGNDLLFQAWRNQEEWLRGRLLINPHTSYFSQASFIEIRRKAAENALRMFQGTHVLNVLI